MRLTAIVTITHNPDGFGGYYDARVEWPDAEAVEEIAGLYDVSSCIAWSRMLVSQASNKYIRP
jgi:hypothetical protein